MGKKRKVASREEWFLIIVEPDFGVPVYVHATLGKDLEILPLTDVPPDRFAHDPETYEAVMDRVEAEFQGAALQVCSLKWFDPVYLRQIWTEKYTALAELGLLPEQRAHETHH